MAASNGCQPNRRSVPRSSGSPDDGGLVAQPIQDRVHHRGSVAVPRRQTWVEYSDQTLPSRLKMENAGSEGAVHRTPETSRLTCDQIVTYCRSVEQGGEVFRALGDPTRRALLDSLFSRDGQTLNELCSSFPEMTRFGVMKHLSVLAEANLVVTARQGRTKRHYLNPVPIEQVANRWISKYAARFTSALVALDEQVVADQEAETSRKAETA
jgi:DNA-binding transcriptional ArsR family regulator